jgi:hypothetical protein
VFQPPPKSPKIEIDFNSSSRPWNKSAPSISEYVHAKRAQK